MSLLDEARAIPHGRGPQCTVGILLESLGPGERAELEEALEANVFGTSIAKVLQKRGHNIKAEALNRHRRRNCLCPS